jgi:hypothetical protein
MLSQIPDNGDETWRNIDNAGIVDMNKHEVVVNTRPAIGDTRGLYTLKRS